MTFILSVPLQKDDHGTWFVSNTRIGLDVLIANYQRGLTPEQIVEELPTLELGQVYAVLAFYLRNQAAVEAELAVQESRVAEIQRQIESGEYLGGS